MSDMLRYDARNWHWTIGGDDSQYWSSALGAYVEELPEGAGVSDLPTEAELDEVLAVYGLLGPTARPTVRKSIVQQRLIDVDKMGDAYAALTSNADFFARWFAPDRPVVYCDDPDAIALLTAIGADVETIMAPE